MKSISKIYKELLRQRDTALTESQTLDVQKSTLEKELGKVRTKLELLHGKEKELSIELHSLREQEATVHLNCVFPYFVNTLMH